MMKFYQIPFEQSFKADMAMAAVAPKSNSLGLFLTIVGITGLIIFFFAATAEKESSKDKAKR